MRAQHWNESGLEFQILDRDTDQALAGALVAYARSGWHGQFARRRDGTGYALIWHEPLANCASCGAPDETQDKESGQTYPGPHKAGCAFALALRDAEDETLENLEAADEILRRLHK